MDLARLGQPTCQQLAEEVGETVNLAVHDGEAAINVAQEFGTSSVTTRNWVGRRTPCTRRHQDASTVARSALLTMCRPG